MPKNNITAHKNETVDFGHGCVRDVGKKLSKYPFNSQTLWLYF